MRRLHLLLTACVGVGIILVVSARSGDGQQPLSKVAEAKSDRTVTVVGTATMRANADAARVTVGVRATGATAKAAGEQAAKNAKKLTDSLETLKIPDLKIAVTGGTPQLAAEDKVPFEEVQQPGKGERPRGQPAPKCEAVSRFVIEIANDDPNALHASVNRVSEAILDSGLELRPDSGTSDLFEPLDHSMPMVTPFRRDLAALRRLALTKAVREALESAAAGADGLKVKVAGPVNVIEEEAARILQPMASWYGPSTGSGHLPVTGVILVRQPGVGASGVDEIQITVRVAVTCTY